MKLIVEPGGEQHVPFAKKKLAELKAQLASGMHLLTNKNVFCDDGARIYIQAQPFEAIRIRASKAGGINPLLHHSWQVDLLPIPSFGIGADWGSGAMFLSGDGSRASGYVNLKLGPAVYGASAIWDLVSQQVIYRCFDQTTLPTVVGLSDDGVGAILSVLGTASDSSAVIRTNYLDIDSGRQNFIHESSIGSQEALDWAFSGDGSKVVISESNADPDRPRTRLMTIDTRSGALLASSQTTAWAMFAGSTFAGRMTSDAQYFAGFDADSLGLVIYDTDTLSPIFATDPALYGAASISPDGNVLLGYEEGPGGLESLVSLNRNTGTRFRLGIARPTFTASAMTSDGSVACGVDRGRAAVCATSTGEVVQLPSHPSAPDYSQAYSISHDGRVVVGFAYGPISETLYGMRAIVWRALD